MTDEKNAYKILSYFAVVVALMCVLFRGFGTESRDLSNLQNDTDSTVGNLKGNSAVIGVEIGRSQESIIKTKESLERVESEVRSGREISRALETGIDDLERIIGEAQGYARRSADIIDAVDEAAQ